MVLNMPEKVGIEKGIPVSTLKHIKAKIRDGQALNANLPNTKKIIAYLENHKESE